MQSGSDMKSLITESVLPSAGAVRPRAAEEAESVVGGVEGGGGVHRHAAVHHRTQVLHRRRRTADADAQQAAGALSLDLCYKMRRGRHI